MAPSAVGLSGSPKVNGMTNGPVSSSMSSSSSQRRNVPYTFKSSTANGSSADASTSYVVRNTAAMLSRSGASELGSSVFESVSRTSFIDVVEYIASVRLSSLPHKGGKWDKVLIRALYFVEQQEKFEKMVKRFGAEDSTASHLAYGYCKLLLELGHENAVALDKAFAVLYKYSLEVASLLHRSEVVATTSQIREQLSHIYGDLLTLTSTVGALFYKTVHGMTSSQTSLDIYEVCGAVIESFQERQAKVAELIWRHSAESEGLDSEQVSSKQLKAWLLPSDPVLNELSQSYDPQVSDQADFTGLWIQKPLGSFVQGQNEVMVITGQQGSGKSVLAASIVERLQRTLARKPFSTLYYRIDKNIPSAANPINILKSLLAQILDLRLGNMQTYHAIQEAFQNSTFCADLKQYETYLWKALDEALKKPLDSARDMVIVVDGIDELQGGKAFFDKLANTVGEGKRVKLIGAAETLSLPSGLNATQITVTRDRVRDDIHAVCLRSLMHSRNLTSKPGPEQEQVLDRITRASNGSFVWATLVSELLVEIKSPDEFTKTLDGLEKSKPAVADLVQRVITRQELSPIVKTILGFVVTAERPLSFSDIKKLLSSHPRDNSPADDELDIPKTLAALTPILSMSDNVVRPIHSSVQEAIISVINSDKINLPFETRQSDMLLRLLNFATVNLKEQSDPSFDVYESDVMERTLHEHPFLAYIVRYWPTHYQRLGVSKQPKDMAQVLPTTTILSQLERALWSVDYPLPQNLELQKTSMQVRQTVLKETSPALLQTTMNAAIIYEMLGRPTEAAPLYYWCSKTAYALLGNHHPLSVELGFRFIRITDNMVETKRTQTMTQREEVLKIIITLMERQYGSTSTQVLEIRTMLAQLYEHIQEQQRATEIYQTIHQSTVQVLGRDSSQARGVSDHLKVTLGKSKTDQTVQTRKDAVFDDEDEIYVEETLDYDTATRRLKAAKTELEFVELWQQISALCRNTTAVEWHEKNIDTAMAYSRYLATQKRNSEAVAVSSSLAREYESNEVSFSERIVSRLSETAAFMKSMGQYTAALSILKRTSQLYQSLRKEESSEFAATQREITTVMTELVQSSSGEAEGDVLEDVFRTTIKNEAKAVDAKIMSIARTLTLRHMDHSRPAEAIEIVRLVLHRTWPAFLGNSMTDLDMPAIFPKETTELVEFMAQCYDQLRQPEQVETTLVKLFNASLTPKSIDFTFLNKIQTLLITHFDQHNHPERAIGILQRSLPARKAGLGPTHDDTIKTLYELGRRSRDRARLYPYWIDSYTQIVTFLNKDSDICQPRALDALIVVTTSYWEDERYNDAVYYFNLLWNTMIQKPKEFSQFGQPDFVERLYSRYYTCLERTGARFDSLYSITTQYRTICTTIFGAQASITTKATLSLARLCYTNEKHTNEALSLYEDTSRQTGADVHKGEIQRALSTLYTRQVITTSSSSVKSETIESARSRTVQQLERSVSEVGYSHQTSLTYLQEMAVLYYKQNKSETAAKELTKASTTIITKETSSTKLIAAAESIFQSFQASNTTEHCKQLFMELQRQVVFKDTSKASSWGFDLTKYGRSVLPFLAVMEVRLSADKKISFTQVMAELTVLMLYYDEYRGLIKNNASLHDILMKGSLLRAFLVKTKRDSQVTALDDEVAAIFVSRDGGKMKLMSKHSARIFMASLMEYLGTHKSPSFIKAVVLASKDRLEKLMAAEQYTEAYDIAHLGFAFAVENEGYSGPKGIGYGFNMASTLAGIGYNKKCPDAGLRKQMLNLSNDIVKKVLEVCRSQNINFVDLQLHELNRLTVLLGEVQNYETLEWLLTSLWNTKEAHKEWSSKVLQNLGRRLICARYMAGHPIKALRLCEDIAYNMRRTQGPAHPITRDMNVLLAQLYTGTALMQQGSKDKANVELANQYYTKAVNVHESMLRSLVDIADGTIDDDEDLDSTGAILAEHGVTLNTQSATNGSSSSPEEQAAAAKMHLHLLKLSYQRLGYWPRPQSEYESLVGEVVREFSIDSKESPDKWQVKGFGGGKAESNDGVFDKVNSWQLVDA